MNIPTRIFKTLMWAQGWKKGIGWEEGLGWQTKDGDLIPVDMRTRAYRAAKQAYDPALSKREWARRALCVLEADRCMTSETVAVIEEKRDARAHIKAVAEDGLAQARAKVAAMRERRVLE
jgi:hypothetical protein